MQAGESRKPESGAPPPDWLAADDRATSFEACDGALVQAVQQHWQSLLDGAQVVPRSGKVVLDFNLTPDGRVTDMKVTACQVGLIVGWLCQRAVGGPGALCRVAVGHAPRGRSQPAAGDLDVPLL
jgi:hypothetical protein